MIWQKWNWYNTIYVSISLTNDCFGERAFENLGMTTNVTLRELCGFIWSSGWFKTTTNDDKCSYLKLIHTVR